MTSFQKPYKPSDDGDALVKAADYAAMRTALSLVPGTNVQAYSASLLAIAGLEVTDSNIIVGNGTTWVAETGADARTSLGLGTANSPQFTSLGIGGVAVANVPITAYQTADSKGMKIAGYEDQQTAVCEWHVSDAGITYITASTSLRLSATNGYLVVGSAAANTMYLDAGLLFTFRDKDDNNAIRLTIDSANGELAIRSDTVGLKLDAAGTTTIISNGTTLTINKALTIGGDLNANGGTIHFGTAENVSTPTGTTVTIDLGAENHHTLNCGSATGTVEVTFTAPPGPTAGTIIIIQDDAPKDITWPVSCIWLGTEPTWSSDTSKTRIVSWRYNATNYYLSATDTTA